MASRSTSTPNHSFIDNDLDPTVFASSGSATQTRDILDGGSAVLDTHHREFQALVDTARRHARRGRLAVAASYAQSAGRFAWINHTGLFASPELETLLAQIGARCVSASRPSPASRSVETGSQPRTVLHVVTQTYQTGGHTRAVRCWIDEDSGRRHRICITRQGLVPPPGDLVAQLRTPADLIRLDARPGLLLHRAAALRSLATDCDLVILHTHPYDVVPLIAFADSTGRPPVVYANHADHCFWLGMGVSDVLMNMRLSGQRLATARRGVDPSRSIIVPWPLLTPARSVSSEKAKQRLGVAPDQVLLVTAADATKYLPMTGTGLLDLVLSVVQRHKNVVLFAAGPAPEGPWLTASERTGGRLRALGRLPDVTPLHEAADVYLDSSPISSLTSLLEAGSFGTPIVTYGPNGDPCAVFGADIPSISEHMLSASDPETYANVLASAITDSAWRREIGARTRQAILTNHTGDGWQAAVEDMYRMAARVERSPSVKPIARQTGEADLRVDAVMATMTWDRRGSSYALRDNLPLLPVAQRFEMAARLVHQGVRLKKREVVPEWLLPHLGRCRDTAARLRSRMSTQPR